ncbi:MAG: OmpA family protein [Treponema sp.]|jgi:outer membrane protein OmpA-like peptidoglycan-associated protein|nr:OmpA family protein [Treponema sp.]
MAKCLFLVFFILSSVSGWGEEFVFKYREGDKYRILSTVKEDVYIDKKLNHRAEILNRIAVEVTGVKNGSGTHRAVFQAAENAEKIAAAGGFQWAREYESVFDRDELGHLSIDSKYFMPVVRDVPILPGRELKAGDKWIAAGHEMHDFRDSFGIAEPYRIPFTANYTYLGIREWKGKPYPAFSVSYSILARPPAVRGKIWPRRIEGSSDQIVYWEPELGQAAAYEEHFRMLFELSDGRTVEYKGQAEAEIIEAEYMDKEKIASEIAAELERLAIPDATVRITDEGIAISLENIQFLADSARLLPSEQRKLDQIAEILKKHSDRDIQVGGHTALAGNAAGREQLSLERAGAVADYFLGKGVRTKDRIVIRGYGAERPIADNRTETGRQKNRRVEITILEN